MPQQDVQQIKAVLVKFLRSWTTRNIQDLDTCFIPEAACSLGVVRKNPFSLDDLHRFVLSTAACTTFRIDLANFVALVRGSEAQQSACLLAVATQSAGTSFRSFEFQAICSNSFVRTSSGWKIWELKIDFIDPHGDFTEFARDWCCDSRIGWHQDGILPVIVGELDSPWVRIPDPENNLSELDAVLMPFFRYAFGLDTLSMAEISPVLADGLTVVMPPYGTMDKRSFLATLKIQRQTEKTWIHPVELHSAEINGDRALVRFYRTGGHGRRPFPLTADNLDRRVSEARYELQMTREKGFWQISHLSYALAPCFLDLDIVNNGRSGGPL
jgi:hypothetical protein